MHAFTCVYVCVYVSPVSEVIEQPFHMSRQQLSSIDYDLCVNRWVILASFFTDPHGWKGKDEGQETLWSQNVILCVSLVFF